MNKEQLAILKADILAATDQPTVDARLIRDDVTLATLYNAQASPLFWVWRSTLTAEQARAAIAGGEGLSQLDNLTAGKRDALLWLFQGTTQPASAAQRDAIQNLCGTQNLLKAAITAAQKRTVTRAERLYATGTGTEATPGVSGWEGTVTHMDISDALNG